MSEEREHTSRHTESEESQSPNKDHRKCYLVAPLSISQLKRAVVTDLFDKILGHIRDIHLSQSSLTFPSIFLIYAHENDDLAQPANADGARKLIEWLDNAHFNLHSDKTYGYDPSNTLPPGVLKADTDKILSSQLRLLPSGHSYNSVILCGSQVLGEYVRSPYYARYTKRIESAYQKALEAGKSEELTRIVAKEIGDVVKSELENKDFHHILTELACLSIRANKLESDALKSGGLEGDGIIPILLNGNKECFPKFIQDSDGIRIEQKRGHSPNQHLHMTFFRLLQRLLPQKSKEI